MSTKFYRYNLGLSSTSVQQIKNDFYAHSENVDVYKTKDSICGEFYAGSEKEIDNCIEEACAIIRYYYPKLSVDGTAFEEEAV